MLHFEAVIGKVVLSTFFLCVLSTLWMTIVSLITVTSECNIMFKSSLILANP